MVFIYINKAKCVKMLYVISVDKKKDLNNLLKKRLKFVFNVKKIIY